ncbi:MAG: hypothetical protein ACFE7R_03700 [Candidatus Hodarchaeota archaeon]
MATSFNTIVDDLKSSIKLAYGSMLSYFLANLGMLIVLALIIGIAAIPIIALVLYVDAAVWEVWAQSAAVFAAANPWAAGGIVVLIGIPIVALFLTVIGAVYGMSKDLVAHGETKAERAFSWFRHKFLTFAGAGVLLTIVILLPPVVVWGSISILLNYTIPTALNTFLSVFTFIWLFITVGLCAMVYPAITYGKGVQEAFKESFQLARARFDRVYGLLSAVIVLFGVSYGPMIAYGLYMAGTAMVPPLDAILIVLASYTVIVTFLWLLLLLPMTIIAFTKVYAEMTGGQVATQKPPQIPFV